MKDEGDCAIENRDAGLRKGISLGEKLVGRSIPTTLRVPTSSFDGASFWLTISEMKFAAMPMHPSREMTCSMRTTLKVAPRAP